MINVREPEIRNESLELVVEAHLVANQLLSSDCQTLRAQLLDSAFLVSSNVANAFTALQDVQFEAELEAALTSIATMKEYLEYINANHKHVNFRNLHNIMEEAQEELESVMADTHRINVDFITPKLEKVCI